MPTWCNQVILLMYSYLDMWRVHTPIIRSITCGYCCAKAPSAPYTLSTQRLSRPPPIQKLGAENHTLQLNIQCSWRWAYVPKTCQAKNILKKLPSCIKLAFHFISRGRCTVKQPSSTHGIYMNQLYYTTYHVLQAVLNVTFCNSQICLTSGKQLLNTSRSLCPKIPDTPSLIDLLTSSSPCGLPANQYLSFSLFVRDSSRNLIRKICQHCSEFTTTHCWISPRTKPHSHNTVGF